MSQTPSQRRLQRLPDFTGDRLDTFRQLFVRHGLPGLLLGLLLFAPPDIRGLLHGALPASLSPNYWVGAIAIGIGLSLYAATLDRQWLPQQTTWIVYLGALSLWEEWVFRLAIPYYIESIGFELWAGVILANLLFGVMHYFTLRWKWQWCVASFLGGMALSRQMHLHNDLLLITAYHWIATFLNTPRSPGSRTP